MGDEGTQPSGLQTTKPGRVWFIKSGVIIAALLAFGGWALYDATVLYPARGAKFAEFAEYQYLLQIRQVGPMRNAAMPDPAATYRSLNEKRADLGELGGIEGARYLWLQSLSHIGRLNEQGVGAVNEDARARLDELTNRWATENTPKPLASYDIPSQWLILAVCWALGLWLLLGFVRSVTTKYRWDATAKRLHLPGGATLEPSDVAEFDKRKWDKFLIFLQIREAHATLGGRELKLDLYKHNPLEDWVLEMERIAFPETAGESAGQETGEADEGGEAESAPAEASA